MATLPSVRITLTKEMQEQIEALRLIYPTLTDAELIKLAVGGYCSQNLTPRKALKKHEAKEQMYEMYDKIQQFTGGKNLGKTYTQEEIDANTYAYPDIKI